MSIIDAIIQNESGGNPDAQSSKGAEGLMQIEPDTARTYGVDPATLKDPRVNRAVGARYYNDLLKRYGGDHWKALAAYNWGPSRTDKAGDNISAWPKETRDYVGKVMADSGAIDWSKATVVPDVPGVDWSKAKVVDSAADAGLKLRSMLDKPTTPSDFAGQVESKREGIEGKAPELEETPLVENLTIGAITGGMGLPLGTGYIPKTVAGKLLSIPAGTAEQYLYGWASEKAANYAQRKAGQSGYATVRSLAPEIGAAAGVGGALAAGGLESGAAGRIASLRELPESQLEEARQAAQGAENQFYEDAPKGVYEFGQSVQKANEKATKAAGVAITKSAALRSKELDSLTADDRAAAQRLNEQAGQQVMEGMLGRSSAEAAATRRMPLEDLALHRANARNTVFGPIQRISDQLGKQFDTATEGRLTEPAKNTEAISKALEDEGQWLGEHGKGVSAPVQALIDRLPQSGEGKATVPAGEISNLLSGEGPAKAKAALTQSIDQWSKAHPDTAITGETLHSLASQALGGPRTELHTLGELLGLRTEASKLTGSQADHNQVVAMQLRDAIDQSLMDSGVDIPKELREQWGTYKSLFDKGLRRSVATGSSPFAYGKKLFETPERALAVYRNATSDEQQSLKQLLADHILNRGYSPKQLGKKIDAGVLREYFGDTPYSRLTAWADSAPKATAWQSAAHLNPKVEALIQQGERNELRQIARDRAQDVRDAGVKLAQKLGPAARGKLAKILAAHDPEGAAKVVEQEFPLSPQDAQQLYAQAQQTPGKAAFDSVVQAKQMERGLDINQLRENAAVSELMKQANNPVVANLRRRLWSYHFPMMLAQAGIGAAAGHAAFGYQGAISGMLLGMIQANRIKDALRPALTSPEAAREYWQAINMAPSTLNASRFGARMARIAIAVGLRKMQEQDNAQEEAKQP